jgi:hypothetical protein
VLVRRATRTCPAMCAAKSAAEGSQSTSAFSFGAMFTRLG